MSQSISKTPAICTYEIKMSAECKQAIAGFNGAVSDFIDILTTYKASLPSGGLLAAMEANDAVEPKLKELGQWVFEGQDEDFISAAMDADGEVWIYRSLIKDLARNRDEDSLLWYSQDGSKARYVCMLDTNADWQNCAINREPVNDVDYLSDTPADDDTAPIESIFSDEELAAVCPQITPADMNILFIKQLADVLIQRMHSMDRFSEDGHAVNGKNFQTWDILVYEPLDAYGVLVSSRKISQGADLLFFKNTGASIDADWHTGSEAFRQLRTISKSEISAFSAALETYYG